MNPKISVIVPIYNTEKYLDKCLSSIINQTMQEIEIICVDDCSPDNSSSIVEKYIEQDSRVSLIRHEKNKGVGGARNTGILAAKGDYLASVDSDDFIRSEMMKALWDASEDGKYDIVSCGFDVINELGQVLSSSDNHLKVVCNVDNSINIFSTVSPEFWGKLWRRSLFIENKIFFPESMYYEDTATTPRILAKIKMLKVISDNLYYYSVRSDSIMRTFGAEHIIDTFKMFDILSDFLRTNNLTEHYESEFLDRIENTIYGHSKSALNSGNSEKVVSQHLRYMLMLKSSYMKQSNILKLKNKEELLQLLSKKYSRRYKKGINFLRILIAYSRKKLDNF